MSLIFDCPHCKQKLEGEDNWVGMEVPCPCCKKTFKIPSPKNDDSQNGFVPLENDNNFAPVGNDKGFASLESTDSGNNSVVAVLPMQDDATILAARQRLTKCFEHAQTMQAVNSVANAVNSGNGIVQLLGVVGSLFARKSKATEKDVAAFNTVIQKDLPYIVQLDMLSYVGKKASQLIAVPHTFGAPAVMSSDCAFAFAGNDRDFIYSAEEITKIYIFKDQLIQVHALWDYTTGTLLNEQSEAFFFRDITDISTEYGYEKIIEETPNKLGKILFIIGIILIATIILSIIGLTMILFSLIKLRPEKKQYYVRKSETFRITSTSGRSMSMSLLCSEWIKAKKGKFEQRTSNEKIFHAIRKMVEEKKIEATNG